MNDFFICLYYDCVEVVVNTALTLFTGKKIIYLNFDFNFSIYDTNSMFLMFY